MQHGKYFISYPSKIYSPAFRYLYELGDYDRSIGMTENGIIACGDRTTPHYVGLCLTKGACFFELNRLVECRKAWEEAQRVYSGQIKRDQTRGRRSFVFIHSPLSDIIL